MKKLLLSFLVMLASVAMVNAMDTVYLHQFTAKPKFLAAGSTDSLSGIEWTISDSLIYSGFDTGTSLRGWQIGSSKKVQLLAVHPVQTLMLQYLLMALL